MILYYSGTGNSRYVAKRIAEKIGDKNIINLGKLVKSGKDLHIENVDNLIFVYPTYAGRMPVFLSKYLSKQNFKEGAKSYFVTTCGASGGNQSKNLKAFCDKLKLSFQSFFVVVMPENYIALFHAPSEEKAKAIINKANPHIDRITEKIAKEYKLKHITGFVKSPYNDIFYKMVVKAKGFHTDSGCVGCGKCANVCVLNNIKLQDDKPVWGDACTHCMACINSCPTKAIQYKTATQKKRRYLLEDK